MRTRIFQHGEAVHRYLIAAPESFGRVGRRQPIALAWMAANGHGVERDACAVENRRLAIDLHAAARANRMRGIGDLVVLSLRFIADKSRRLIAAVPSNFPFFQPKE